MRGSSRRRSHPRHPQAERNGYLTTTCKHLPGFFVCFFLSKTRRSLWGTRSESNTPGRRLKMPRDRKSTRLNSSHVAISYAVFCLKKKKKKKKKHNKIIQRT